MLSMATPAVRACRFNSARWPSSDMRSFLKCPCFTAMANSSRAFACKHSSSSRTTCQPHSKLHAQLLPACTSLIPHKDEPSIAGAFPALPPLFTHTHTHMFRHTDVTI